jgi:drug/metabolite transporter (DMT)-like permease
MKKNKLFLAYLALAAVCFFWGTTYFAIRIAIVDFPPLLLGGLRHLIAGLVLIAFMWRKGIEIPPKQELKKIFIAGLFFLLLSNVSINWAEKYIASGLAALLCSLLPCYVLIFNIFLKNDEKQHPITYIGLLAGLIGMFLIFYDSLDDIFNGKYLPGILLIVFANAAWAYGSIYLRKSNLKTNPLLASGLQMFLVGLFTTLISLVTGEYQLLHVTADGVYALSYLILFGSLVGYNSFVYATTQLPSTLVSIYSYINPVVAIVLGTVFLNEKITFYTLLSIIFILFAVFLINLGHQKILNNIKNG